MRPTDGGETNPPEYPWSRSTCLDFEVSASKSVNNERDDNDFIVLKIPIPSCEALFALKIELNDQQQHYLSVTDSPLFLSVIPPATLSYALAKINSEDRIFDGFFIVQPSEVLTGRRTASTTATATGSDQNAHTSRRQFRTTSLGSNSNEQDANTNTQHQQQQQQQSKDLSIPLLPLAHLSLPRVFGEIRQQLKNSLLPLIITFDSRHDPILSSIAANCVSMLANIQASTASKLQDKLKLLCVLISNVTGGSIHEVYAGGYDEKGVSEAIGRLWQLIAEEQHNQNCVVLGAGRVCALIATSGLAVFERCHKSEVIVNLRAVLFKYICDRSGISGVTVKRNFDQNGLVKVQVACISSPTHAQRSINGSRGKNKVDTAGETEIVFNVDVVNCSVSFARPNNGEKNNNSNNSNNKISSNVDVTRNTKNSNNNNNIIIINNSEQNKQHYFMPVDANANINQTMGSFSFDETKNSSRSTPVDSEEGEGRRSSMEDLMGGPASPKSEIDTFKDFGEW